jgi:hypothetical protein
MRRASCRRSTALAALAVFLGCSGGDGPSGPSSIDVALSSPTVSIVQGSSSSLTVTVARTNFSGDVQLSVEHSVSGVTTTLTSATLGAGQNQSTLTVNVAAAATAGTNNLTVRARGTNVTDRTVSLALTVTPAPGYTLSLPASLQLEPGHSGSLDIALARLNFSGAVSLSVEGLPTGASGALAPNPVTAGTAVLTVSTGTAAPGTYPVTIRGTAAGLTDRVATFTLILATPSYTLTLGSSTVTLPQGQGTAVNIALARSDFTGPVAIAVADVPAGASVTVSPASTTGSSAVLSVNAGSAAPGTYPLTVRGTAPGLADRSATVTLTVAPAPPSTNIVYQLCAPSAPVWVGYQSGAGAWTTLPTSASGSYTFSVAGVGGFAFVLPNSGDGVRFGYSTAVVYGSAADLNTMGGGTCAVAGTKSMSGLVSGLLTGETATIALDGASTTVPAPTTGTTSPFTLDRVADGAHDLVATRDFVTNSGQGASKVIIRRVLDPASGTALPTLDFSSTEALTPVTPTLTVANGGADQPLAFADFVTGNGTPASLSGSYVTAGQASYRGIPAASLLTGDLHSLLTYVSTSTAARGVQAYFQAATDRTLTLPPAITTPTVSTVASSPYARFRTQLTTQSEYGVLLFTEYEQQGSTPATDRLVDVIVTAGYFNGLPQSWVAVVPDLTGAAGFGAAWGLAAGVSTSYYVEVDGGAPLGAQRANGATITFAATGGTTSSSAASASIGASSLTLRRRSLLSPLGQLALPRGRATIPLR